jgi:transposase
MVKRTRRRYSEEFKAEAVNLLEQYGYGVAEAARRRPARGPARKG